MKKNYFKVLICTILTVSAFAFTQQNKPALHTIGDSTVRNSNKETWGWEHP
jgi:rhamnogalacturonan acetylesterase